LVSYDIRNQQTAATTKEENLRRKIPLQTLQERHQQEHKERKKERKEVAAMETEFDEKVRSALGLVGWP
jgi:hypothetical protein